MQFLAILFWGIIAYVIGSIPSSVWIGKSYFGKDVRDYGSGNAGATNTFRVLGTQAGIVVLLLDIFKGVTAASLILYLPSISHGTDQYVNLQLLFGILAVVGHIFPVFENFNGGKGIATLFGMLIGIHYLLAVACVALFIVVLLLTRYVSLSSILATISFPIFTIYIFHRDEPLLIAFGVAAALMVVITHKKNIIRLMNGEESKAKLFRSKS
ncbi:MAG: glycerol-3-phosphate 1-O-acyltransferase PlsY [Bacteroidia bacterium]|nr:glycerol-3-phosphate 1-O-acyltransferase PlsY [Bacteroidia bacterium]MDG2041655.1 glycerol-3-phosphate 1-O-acyltransferase PlsY [Bacteroidia bacterium]|tara:strand:+ start:5762 stop:6397 length:636 start_codon:yes stop_codon:yes gene_type:complete